MIKLIDILLEAFTFFPTSEDEIENDAVRELFKIVKKYPGLKLEDPIGMSDPESSKVKISRSLQNDPNFIKYLSSKLKKEIKPQSTNTWNGVKIEWGHGSRGGRGLKSKGLGAESSIVGDLNTLKEEGISKANLSQFAHPDLMIEMSKELGLKKGNFEIESLSHQNQKRPLAFTSSGPIIDFSNETVAQTLTDITITKGSNKYYISVKYGGTVNFFNAGVTKALPASEIKTGKIINPNGVALLETFGINNKLFCQVFNDYGTKEFSKYNKNPESTKYDIEKMKRLIESGIGSGYYMAHVGKGSDQFFKVDKKYTKTASDVTSPKIYYGGIGGKAKRVDIVFESSLYTFKVNIRSSSAKIYPSHILCQYSKK